METDKHRSTEQRDEENVVPRTPPPRETDSPPDAAELKRIHQIAYRATSGPIPDPEEMARYEAAHPGAQEIIYRWASEEIAHRHKVEEIALRGTLDEARRGQLCATIVCVAAIMMGGVAVITGHPVAGTVLGGAGLALIIRAFLYRGPKP